MLADLLKYVSWNKWALSYSFFSTLELSWQVVFKTAKVKWDFLTDIDILIMVEKRIKGGTCQTFYRYVKANNKHMENYDEKKERIVIS